jgi:hypothetical protein
MTQKLWRTEHPNNLAAEIGPFRLTVQLPEKVGDFVRFLVLRRESAHKPETLVGSGSEEDVRSAMAAAERVAERCAGL